MKLEFINVRLFIRLYRKLPLSESFTQLAQLSLCVKNLLTMKELIESSEDFAAAYVYYFSFELGPLPYKEEGMLLDKVKLLRSCYDRYQRLKYYIDNVPGLVASLDSNTMPYANRKSNMNLFFFGADAINLYIPVFQSPNGDTSAQPYNPDIDSRSFFGIPAFCHLILPSDTNERNYRFYQQSHRRVLNLRRATDAVAILIFDVTNVESFNRLGVEARTMFHYRGEEDYRAYALIGLTPNQEEKPRVISHDEALQKAKALNMPYYEINPAQLFGFHFLTGHLCADIQLNAYPPKLKNSKGLFIFDFDETVAEAMETTNHLGQHLYRLFTGVKELFQELCAQNITLICVTGREWTPNHTECFGEIFSSITDDRVFDIVRSKRFMGLPLDARPKRADIVKAIISYYGFNYKIDKVHYMDDDSRAIIDCHRQGIHATQVQFVSPTKNIPTAGFYDDVLKGFIDQINGITKPTTQDSRPPSGCIIS